MSLNSRTAGSEAAQLSTGWDLAGSRCALVIESAGLSSLTSAEKHVLATRRQFSGVTRTRIAALVGQCSKTSLGAWAVEPQDPARHRKGNGEVEPRAEEAFTTRGAVEQSASHESIASRAIKLCVEILESNPRDIVATGEECCRER
jgi:hypothetical protein